MNISLLLLFPITAAVPLSAETPLDFLRFKNGDTLHGQYLGLDEGPLIQWKSSESEDAINFDTQNLRKLTLRKGRAEKPLVSPGLVVLSNGDRIPGSVIAMGEDSVSLQTEFAGLLTIPRKNIEQISPNRHGGSVLYAGPFNDEDWSVPGVDKGELEIENTEKKEELPPPLQKNWVHGGAAWYSNSPSILRLDQELPTRFSIRFNLAWQPPLNANIAVFSDFQRPHRVATPRVRRVVPLDEKKEEEPEEAKEEGEEPPRLVDIMKEGVGTSEADSYGSGYLISILSSYSRLQRLGFDNKLMGKKTSFPNSGGRLNLGDLYAADFEIRADRDEGKLTLFVNGEFFSEWQDLAEPLDDAERYFAISAGGKSRLRVSDVVVSEWNGMPDSARSMKTEERDVLLLTNGTDRFSGKVLTLEEDIFRVESSYGVFQIPADEVTDIRLATNSVERVSEPSEGQVMVSFQPNGLLTILPKQGLANSLQGEHPILGELSLDLSFAYLLEFDPIGSIFDNWDDEF